MKTISRHQMFMVAAFVIPLLGVGVARVLPLGASPATAAAAQSTGESVTEAADLAFEIPNAFDQEIAQKSITQLYRTSRHKPFARTPLVSPPKPQPALLPPVPAEVPLTTDQRIIDALKLVKSLEFTSILTGREVLAVISGRPRHVGSVIKNGWTLVSIDNAANTVELHHELAGNYTLQLKQRFNTGENKSTIEPVQPSGQTPPLPTR